MQLWYHKSKAIWYFYVKHRWMVVFPKAKINLGLRITGRRIDGYHNIETLFYPVGLCDALEFVESADGTGRDILTVTGIDVGISAGENIVMKAVARLRKDFSFPWLSIHLHKAIPHGAGLGGGSSDAACLIKSINRHFSLSINNNDLRAIALEIGSDCPFFIQGEPAFATGRGEVFEPADHILSGLYLILVNPKVGIGTGEAYSNSHPALPEVSLSDLVTQDMDKWKDTITNDFEEYAFKKHPVIREIKDSLYSSGAIFSLMSGSGSTVYGLFRGKPDYRPQILRDYTVWEGLLY
jgi:4-diphosphocytidyl-2-C-methyl-D-erythritol kinase